MVIWKYPIPLQQLAAEQGQPILKLPQGATLLTVQVQQGTPTVWALVDASQPLVPRQLKFVETGVRCEDLGPYVGTVQLHEGSLVLHVFEAP